MMSRPAKILVRQLGANGPQVPAVGFGLMGMSVGYGPAPSDTQRLELLDHAWSIGCTNWDTADAYGDNEDIIGKWFELHPERRKDIFLATKFGLKANSEGLAIDSSPEYCESSLTRSLKRLGLDYVDLYYLHRPDTNVPIEKTVKMMKSFVTAGKVKYLGLSEVSSNTLRRAHAVHPISAVQVEYNPWTIDIEGPSGTDLLKTCRELGVAVLAYSPLGRGIMTGRYKSAAEFGPDDARANMTRFQGENFTKNLKLVDTFKVLAERKGCTPGQLVLAWLVAQGDDIFVIPGTKKIEYLEENFNTNSVTLSEDEELILRKLVQHAGVSGDRDAVYGHYIDTAELSD